MFEKREQFLREYKFEEKNNICTNFVENAYQKVHKLVIESIKKIYDTDLFPIEQLIYPKEEAYAIVRNTILKFWNSSSLDTTFIEIEEKQLYEERLRDCLENDLIDQIANLSRCNYSSFLKLITLDSIPFIVDRKEKCLLSIYFVPIGDKYLVHNSFNLSEKFDFIILQEKFKSLIIQYPLIEEELDIITKNYKDIAYVIGTLAISDEEFLEKNIQELYGSIINSKFNYKYKKQIYLYQLDSAMKLARSDGKKDFHNIFDLDLERKIDTTFYTKLNYSKVQNLVKEIISENYFNNFEINLTEVEKTYIYYCLFIATYSENAYKTVIQIGEYLLDNQKIIKYKKELILNYGCNNGKDEIDFLLRRYNNALLSDFFSKLLDAYVKEKQYVSAMSILDTYNEASSSNLRLMLTIDLDEKAEEVKVEQFKKELEGDICLLITDYDYYIYNEDQIKNIVTRWHKQIQDYQYAEAIYRPLEQHILNIIMTIFSNGRQKLTYILIEAFSTYFTQSKDMFEQFYHFIIMNSENEKLIDKEILNSLKKADFYLSKIQQTNKNAIDVKDELFKVKKIYQNSGTILNDYLTNKKMDSLTSILRKNLDEQTYYEIIDEVITEMKRHLNATNIKQEEIESYFERLKNIELLDSVWDKLEDTSKINLATGMYLYDTQKAFFKNSVSDFSATIINWCLAVENELKLKFYVPFREFCRNKGINLSNVNWNNITFGTYMGIFGCKGTALSKETFYDYCSTIYPNLSRENIIILVNNLTVKLEVARKQFRNKAAHPGILDESSANSCYDLFFPTQNFLIEILKNYK